MFQFLRRLILFALFCSAAYGTLLFAAANAGERIKVWLTTNTNIPVGIPLRGDTLMRFREIRQASDIDVLFVGSSHCYRAFDPRIFAAHGLRSFNMGSTSQSPLNSYFLLREHLARLQPRLIIFEVYWAMLNIDGAESFLDLASALPMDAELAEMLWATGSITAWNGFLASRMDLHRIPPGRARPAFFEDDHYISGGFVEKGTGYTKPAPVLDAREVKASAEQLRYLRMILRMSAAAGAKVCLVVQPMPHATLQSFLNREALGRDLAALADSEGAAYIDFNLLMSLKEPENYFDWNHLSQQGVRAFNLRVLQELESRGLLRFTRHAKPAGN
jgi:hypothetical protein